jgi:hypothetical protein
MARLPGEYLGSRCWSFNCRRSWGARHRHGWSPLGFCQRFQNARQSWGSGQQWGAAHRSACGLSPLRVRPHRGLKVICFPRALIEVWRQMALVFCGWLPAARFHQPSDQPASGSAYYSPEASSGSVTITCTANRSCNRLPEGSAWAQPPEPTGMR